MSDRPVDAEHPAAPGDGRPRRRRAVVAGVLVLALGVGGAGVALALNTGEDPAAPATARPEGAEPGAEASSGTSEAAEAVPDIGGPQIVGSGYRVQAPRAWSDGTAAFTAGGTGVTTFDRAVFWGELPAPQASVVIEIQAANGAVDPAELAAGWREALVNGDPTASVSDAPDTTIAGRRALTVAVQRTNNAGRPVSQLSHFVINDDVGYSITVSYPTGDTEAAAAFDTMLTTWRWGSA